MRKDYQEALRLGQAAERKAIRQGMSPYLPALDSFEEVKRCTKQVPVGLVELPLDRIKGNKELARNNAFANNFMPLFEENTEFAIKWSNLYDSFKEEGIRDAIIVYEYMHNYYVREGNKRVSVSKFANVDYILADVTRIIPEKNDTKEVKAYFEFLDFYKVTKNFHIAFTEPGEYEKLAELLGQDLENEWPDDLKSDLKAAFTSFEKHFRSAIKSSQDLSISETFLIYVSIFPMKTLLTDSDDQIIKNIKAARNELLGSSDMEDIQFLDKAPELAEGVRPTGLRGLFSHTVRYTRTTPLKVAFIYDAEPDESRWIDSHEAGRLYLEEVTGDEVVTQSYQTRGDLTDLAEVLDRAVSDDNAVIFTVSPNMLSETLKAAIKNPKVRYLNCSIGGTSSTVRSYHGKLYEASFLMGILAADLLLREDGGKAERRIGYLVRNFGNMSMASLNAFAIGASMIDPDCRVSMKYSGASGSYDYRKEWEEEGVRIYADFDYSLTRADARRPGVFMIGSDKDIYIGAPYYNWGRYYMQIVQTVLYGEWDARQVIDNHMATNYWFGLSTGVVDIRVSDLPYQTYKLLTFFKCALVSGNIDPFSGELRSQAKVIQEIPAFRPNTVALTYDTLSSAKIASMEWMNDNII
ncbi:MAG: BMP family ABC transporter substrate-binding protein [Lachnospiraceae bacterium]|nr:BMP family ABC transporter substrate-binding protein [Lachnospiraceae bacterium]